MKTRNLAQAAVLGLAILLASSAFASNRGTLQVSETIEMSGQQLAPGAYQLRWDGTGSNVEVSIMRGKKEVAKTSARIVELEKSASFDSAVLDHSNGKTTIAEVRFAGKKYALALGDTEKAGMSPGSTK